MTVDIYYWIVFEAFDWCFMLRRLDFLPLQNVNVCSWRGLLFALQQHDAQLLN